MSFIDDDAETVSDDGEPIDSSKEQGKVEKEKTIETQPYFNPTEAILATMQLLPLPCSAKSSGGGGQSADRQADVRRNVSVVQSYATGGLSMMPRRKSKSQVTLFFILTTCFMGTAQRHLLAVVSVSYIRVVLMSTTLG